MNPIIYQYKDYRRFLKDCFEARKLGNSTYSYRVFNRKAGIRSPSFLSLVIAGKRNLAETGIRKILKGFSLKQEEAHYFRQLVYFNQAATHEEKNILFRELIQSTPKNSGKSIEEAHYHLFSHWYYAAILELVRLDTNKKKDIHWIKKHIYPSVKSRDIQKALEELQLLGLLEKSGEVFRRHEESLYTEEEVQNLSVINYHQQMTHLALRSITEIAQENRELSALTIAVSQRDFLEIKKELQKFIKKLHRTLESSTEPRSIVAQLNLQLFPLSQ